MRATQVSATKVLVRRMLMDQADDRIKALTAICLASPIQRAQVEFSDKQDALMTQVHQGGRMHAIGSAAHTMENALFERHAVAFSGRGWSVALAILVFVVFGWFLWNLWVLY
jgi:hypothetical protein